ncbi:uncharacterized protein LOC111602351 [Drosophila hydei]|uniref:Uncharacterized protein LOC111602351 n=1 Tax=Drosophila hydei TaxID=7224 RepID=A0A6J1M7G0_DROHY|nr:uncharacterized protein LOC111602351 [Drosophila hydei]
MLSTQRNKLVVIAVCMLLIVIYVPIYLIYEQLLQLIATAALLYAALDEKARFRPLLILCWLCSTLIIMSHMSYRSMFCLRHLLFEKTDLIVSLPWTWFSFNKLALIGYLMYYVYAVYEQLSLSKTNEAETQTLQSESMTNTETVEVNVS